MKVVFCTPTRKKPHAAYLASLEASCPFLDAAGIQHQATFEQGVPYISYAMATMLHRALQTDADAVVFLDDDVSWEPKALLKLIETEGDVVGGTYRFKTPEEEYMGSWHVDDAKRPILRIKDGAIKASMVPSGFLKVTREAVRKFMRAYPELIYGYPEKPAVDLFNHGRGPDFRWWGQDYAFCRRWEEAKGNAWLIPDINVDHNDWDTEMVWKGNLHQYLLKLPGGSLAPGTGFDGDYPASQELLKKKLRIVA